MDQAETGQLNHHLIARDIPGLTFDPGPHEYRFQGVVVPSVTQVLKPIENWDFLDDEAKAFYSERGTEVHRTTALFDLDDLVEESVDPDIAGYLASWKRVRANPDVKLLSVEEKVYHPLLRVAGTMDRRALVKRRHSVIDLKAGVKLPSHGVQVMGYRRCWNHNRPKKDQIVDCYTAYLQKDGSGAKFFLWDDATHDSEFIALLTDRNWRTKYAS